MTSRAVTAGLQIALFFIGGTVGILVPVFIVNQLTYQQGDRSTGSTGLGGFPVKVPALFTRFPRLPLRHQYDAAHGREEAQVI